MKLQQERPIVEFAHDAHRVIASQRPSALEFASAIDALRYWAEVSPTKSAYVFLNGDLKGKRDSGGGNVEERHDLPASSLTYLGLKQSVFALARQFQRENLEGERVMIVMGSGLDYLVGFLACLAAGAIAVPLYPPAGEKDWGKLRSVLEDCAPKALLLNRTVHTSFGAQLASLAATRDCRCLLIEDALALGEGTPSDSLRFDIKRDGLAFLQYTSGSTGEPKGVMVTHANILHNEFMTSAAMDDDVNTVFVSWLPFYHDMGMIGMVLRSLTAGAQAVLMSPKSFIRDPAKWLRAVSHYKGTNAGAPNFAYDLCVDKIREEDIDTLDLSSWRVAFNGAEPIKATTLERFYQRFRRAGLKKEALFPCYGLAEATLYVAGGPRDTLASTLELDRAALNEGKVVPIDSGRDGAAGGAGSDQVMTYLSLGIRSEEQTLRIVDPVTWEALPEKSIGEIWLKSPSVARGYWNKPKATAETFHGYTTDSGEGPFLRTGDLGFVLGDNLYITGRIKELVIVNGVNHYPQDIEDTVQSISDDCRVHYGAAFSFDDDKLAIVQAVSRNRNVPGRFEELVAQIRQAVFKVHGIAPSYIGLVNPGEIPKTSSGKIQRGDLRRRLREKKVKVLFSWEADGPSTDLPSSERPKTERVLEPVPVPVQSLSPISPVVEQKIAWIRNYCKTRLNSFLIDERRTIPPYVVLDFGNQGLLGMQIPKQYGGLGLSTREFLRIMEVLGSKDLTLALFVGLNNVLGVRPVLRSGTAELKERYLPSLASGRELASFALTEPVAGSNPLAIETTAVASSAGDYRLAGTKLWSGSAAWSGLMNVFARTVDANGRLAGMSAFAVPQTSPGVRQGPEALTMGMRGMIQNTIYLEDVPVEPWQVLGQEGHGMAVAQDALCYGRLAIGSTCLGATKLCFQIMLQYAGEREISTGNLLHNPHTRSVLTETMHAIAGIEALIDAAAEGMDRGHDIPGEILAVCKSVSTEVLWKTVDRTMQLAGGRGYIESNFIPQLFRDARVFRIFEGPTETLNHYVGSSVLRGRQLIRDYLLSSLPESEVVEHYDTVIHRVRTAQADRDPAVENWQYLAVGEYINHLVLYAAACSREVETASRVWLLEQVRSAGARLDASLGQFDALHHPDVLRAFGAAIDRKLGRREQSGALPNTSLDALFIGRRSETDADADHASRTFGSVSRLDAGPPSSREASSREASSREASSREASSREAVGEASREVAAPAPTMRMTTDTADIVSFLSQWIARRCAKPLAAIGADIEFAMLGLGSIDSIDLSAALSEKYALELDPTVLWNYPNIKELAGFVICELTTSSDQSAAE